MTIIEFCEKYKNMNSDKAKEQMVTAHVKRKYCPILEKRLILQMMIDNSVMTSDSGIKFIDMMTSKINYTLALIALYTDLIIDKKEVNGKEVGENYECYDALIESNAIGAVCEEIGEAEIKEFSSVNATLIDNFERSEGSFEAYMGRVVGELRQSINGIFEMMSDPERLAGIMESLGSLGDITS